ncbi:alpha/beta hydrolase [Aliiroseovarius sp. KMU-50]|uniref:Alpha/beta hydrolase n=1 Tax=Aliiroseovarius salicola TaxID=3009082 RepID=A0ABT4W5Y5_9RHOB|nr:alpha/beta hydrolase [Aliiroseovarius sp. KMU-50]MDA5095824.1 alpha/beta hydrolase [Aliiroseovarius sp. KMU-50]
MKHALEFSTQIPFPPRFPSEMGVFELDTGHLAAVFQGVGVPMVFLHSSASDGRQWRDYASDWSQQHQVVLPDLPGCGGSDADTLNTSYSLESEANAVMAIARHLKQPFHLVGHSYGGAVALKAATQLGPQLASLTLLEPTSFHLMRDGSRFDREMLDQIKALAASVEQAVDANQDDLAMKRFVDFWSGPDAWDNIPAAKQSALLSRVRKLPSDFKRLFHETLRPDDISRLTVPTLIVCGTRSPEPARALSRLIANSIGHSRHRTIDKAGHMLPLTHRSEVNALLMEHIAFSRMSAAA